MHARLQLSTVMLSALAIVVLLAGPAPGRAERGVPLLRMNTGSIRSSRHEGITAPAAAAASGYTFTGHVYRVTPDSSNTPIAGVTVLLYGDDDAAPKSGNERLLQVATTTPAGVFSLSWSTEVAPPLLAGAFSLSLTAVITTNYAYLHLIEVDLPEHISVAAATGSGSALTVSTISFHLPAPGTYGDNTFWDKLLSPPTIWLVANSTDSGPNSLRWAIEQANQHPGPDTIRFSHRGMGIAPATALPPLTDDGTTIDASTVWDGTWPGGVPGVNISGEQLGPFPQPILWLSGCKGCTLKGLRLSGGSIGIGVNNSAWGTIIGAGTPGGRMLIRANRDTAIWIANADGTRVVGSYIGTSNAGNLPEPNGGPGIYIVNGSRNTIGGTGGLEGNIIGASGSHGILIEGQYSKDNIVINNDIGVGHLAAPLPNKGSGIHIGNGASFNGVGGRFDWQSSVLRFEILSGNAIEGNDENGVTIDGTSETTHGNLVIGNRIARNGQFGVLLENGAVENRVEDNTITQNHATGVMVRGANTLDNVLTSNRIGTDEEGTPTLGNGHHGIGLYGGTQKNGIWGNIIGGNGWSGVAIVDAATRDNYLWENWIGAVWPDKQVGNGYYGVAIVDSPGNRVGPRNTIAHNGASGPYAGVQVKGATATGNHMFENSIHSNAGAGIELVAGGNGLLAAPTITSVDCPLVRGTSLPGVYVELYSDDADEGRLYEGRVQAGVSGQWVYRGAYHGPKLTALATNAPSALDMGDTSSFSLAVAHGARRQVYVPLVRR